MADLLSWLGALLAPANPLNPERIAKLCELAWWDGARTGGVAGLLAGVLVGIIVARLLREGRSP